MRIAVLGAGPAGSSAAFHLAAAGRDVLLVDRAAFPRDKVCGDWVTPAALDTLATMGLDDAALAREAPGHAIIRRCALGAPGGAVSVAPLPRPGRCVPRRTLDAAIRARAIGAGCRALQRHVRDPATDDALADYDLVVDARGANAGAPNAIGLRAYWSVPASALDAEARVTVTLQTDEDYARGYGWWFPVGGEGPNACLNVGVGLLAADSRRGATVTDFLARFERTQPALQRLAAAGATRARPVGYHVGLGRWRETVASGRVLRIGDAANLADPLTGDGIGNALRSGALVAAAIVQSNGALAAARAWQALYEQALAPDLRWALLLRRALTSARAKNGAAWLLAHSDRLRVRLHGALFGDIAYRALMRGPARHP